MVKTSIRFFNNKEVRAAWDDATGKWWFCAVDVAAALSGSVEFRRILTGLAYRVWNVAKPSLPLASYRNHMFKLFGVDVGLLAAQSRLAPSVVLEGNRAFTEFKGSHDRRAKGEMDGRHEKRGSPSFSNARSKERNTT